MTWFLNENLITRNWPLFIFVVPTLALGFRITIPEGCIAVFAMAIAGACFTYWLGQKAVLKIGGHDAQS